MGFIYSGLYLPGRPAAVDARFKHRLQTGGQVREQVQLGLRLDFVDADQIINDYFEGRKTEDNCVISSFELYENGEFYFIETSARVGGAGISDMVEAATGINLWSEWAKLEICRTRGTYELPALKERYGGAVISLAPQERPDTSGFTDPEIAVRMDLKNHIGFVLGADTPDRIRELLDEYMTRIAKGFHAVLPAADRAV